MKTPNIIFGAVLDESMGDEVKITVIATGFRQDQMGQMARRSRSASEILVPHVSVLERSSVPRFASEELADPEYSPLFESRKTSEHAPATEKHAMSPEPSPFLLHPVMIEETPEPPRPAPPQRAPMIHSSFDEPFVEEYARLIPSSEAGPGRMEVHGQDTNRDLNREVNHNQGEPHLDNLDIPAFLRRPLN